MVSADTESVDTGAQLYKGVYWELPIMVNHSGLSIVLRRMKYTVELSAYLLIQVQCFASQIVICRNRIPIAHILWFPKTMIFNLLQNLFWTFG